MSQHFSNLNRHHSRPDSAQASQPTAASRPRPVPQSSTSHLSSASSSAQSFLAEPNSPEDTDDFDTAMAASNAHASTSSQPIDAGYMTDDSDSQATEVDDRDHLDTDFWAAPDTTATLDAPSHAQADGHPVSHANHALPPSQDSDLEELLAWGSGEIELEGMPTAGPSDPRSIWYEDQPDFLGIEIATDNDWSESDSDDSMDSTEEAEQLLAIQSGFASDSDGSGSIGDGDTTDSLDDTDHDALVRFGIEEAEPNGSLKQANQLKQKKKKRKGKKQDSPSSENGDPVTTKQRAPLVQEPVLGHFTPQPAHSNNAIVIATEKALIISPYSIKKIRKLMPASLLKQRSRRSSEASSSYASTGTTPSVAADPSSFQALDLPSLVVPEGDEQGEIYMELDLDDILEASVLEGDEGFDLLLQESEDATDAEGVPAPAGNDAVAAAFERWNRIPIGAFRRARQESIGSLEQSFSPETAVRRGSRDQVYMPYSGTVYTSARSFAALNMNSPARLKGRRLKVSRRDAIALSPVLCPVQTTPMPSSIKSHKQRRSEKKQGRKTKSSTSASARTSQSPVKQSQPDDMLLPPSSTVPAAESSSFGGSQLPNMSMAPISPAPFSTFADGEVPPLDLPEAAALFDL